MKLTDFGSYFDPIQELAFDTEMCETCGGVALAPNALKLPGLHGRVAKAGGLTIQSSEGIPEQFYNEETDMCVCSNCHKG